MGKPNVVATGIGYKITGGKQTQDLALICSVESKKAKASLVEKEGKGIESYAPLHEFTARGKGTVMGDFEGVIDLFLKIKRSDLSESIVCGDVRLALD